MNPSAMFSANRQGIAGEHLSVPALFEAVPMPRQHCHHSYTPDVSKTTGGQGLDGDDGDTERLAVLTLRQA